MTQAIVRVSVQSGALSVSTLRTTSMEDLSRIVGVRGPTTPLTHQGCLALDSQVLCSMRAYLLHFFITMLARGCDYGVNGLSRITKKLSYHTTCNNL